MAWPTPAVEVPAPWAQDRARRFAWMGAILATGAALALLPPMVGALVLVGVVAVALAVTRPSWGLALVFLSIPLEFAVLNVGAVGLSAVQVVVLLVVALMIAEMIATGRFAIPKTPLDVMIFVWLAVGFFGAIGADDPAATIKKAGFSLLLAGMYYLVVSKVRRLTTVSMLMGMLVAACSAVGAYGIWVSYRYLSSGVITGNSLIVGSEGLAVPRASSTVGDPTLLAALMVVALPIAMMQVVVQRGWTRLLAIAATTILIVSLGFTFTRGAWIGGAVGLFVLVLERRPRRVLAVLALLLVFLAPGAVIDRASSSTNTGRAEISHRFDYWKGALLVAESRPVFGIGVNNYADAFSKLPVPETSQRRAIHAHNVVLVLLSETGIVGLIAYGSFMAGVLVLLFRRRRADLCEERRLWRLAIAASLIGSFAHQMTDSFLLEPTVNSVVWVFAGLAVLFGDGLIDDGGALEPTADGAT